MTVNPRNGYKPKSIKYSYLSPKGWIEDACQAWKLQWCSDICVGFGGSETTQGNISSLVVRVIKGRFSKLANVPLQNSTENPKTKTEIQES